MSTVNDMTYNEQIEKAINAWGTHWFKFDESNGNITDSKGTAIGTIYGATRTNGWDGDGYAIDFDGADDYVEFNNPLIIQGDKSIRFKLKVKSKSSKTQTILANSNNGMGKKGFFVEIPANTLTIRFVHNNETAIIQEVRSSKELVLGEWADILISADTIKKTYSIFINGELTGSSIITVELSELPNGNLRIGRNTTTLSNAYYSFNGQIDDLQIYSKALTPTDIPILNKTLILSQNEYKKWDSTNGWTTVSSTLPSSTLFLSDGMDTLPTSLDGLNDNFEIITWTDETNSTRTLEVNAIPSPQFIAKATLSDVKGNLNGILTEDLSTYTTSSNVRFLLTNNNSTWYKWNGTDFENVTYSKVDDILTLGNTYDELANADYSKWTHSKINIGVFLKDDDDTTSKVNELGIITNSPIRTSQVSDLNFYILNTTAKIELDLKGLWLSGQLSDLDLTRVQYRVFLNEQPYYPLDGKFTNLDNPPLNIDITFKSEEIKINDWNTLRVEFKDSFGTVDYWQTTFVGNYSSLMFMDTDGNYYSDDVGKVLQYLDFGTFFGGQYSVEHEVIIKNQYGYDVENLTIEASTGHLPEGVEVQFSDTANPFTPQADLLLPSELKNDEQVSFYIRMISDIDSVPNGENKFNIFVKAERKV